MSPDQEEYLQVFNGYTLTLQSLINQRIGAGNQHLQWLLKRLKHPGRRLQEHAQTLDMLEGRLLRATQNRLREVHNKVHRLSSALLLYSPASRLRHYKMQQHGLYSRLQRALQQTVKIRQTQLQNLSRSLENVSPLQTLNRGYSISYDEHDKVLRSSTQVNSGAEMTTILQHGKIISTVKEIIS